MTLILSIHTRLEGNTPGVYLYIVIVQTAEYHTMHCIENITSTNVIARKLSYKLGTPSVLRLINWTVSFFFIYLLHNSHRAQLPGKDFIFQRIFLLVSPEKDLPAISSMLSESGRFSLVVWSCESYNDMEIYQQHNCEAVLNW